MTGFGALGYTFRSPGRVPLGLLTRLLHWDAALHGGLCCCFQAGQPAKDLAGKPFEPRWRCCCIRVGAIELCSIMLLACLSCRRNRAARARHLHAHEPDGKD